MILYHDILLFVIFALQVVLPVNPKMHLDVTLDDIFEDEQEICGNTANLEFCVAVRSTRATLGPYGQTTTTSMTMSLKNGLRIFSLSFAIIPKGPVN